MKLTLEQFTANLECMRSISCIQVKPTIYRKAKINNILKDFNQMFLENSLPYRLKYIPTDDRVNYLRFETERMDRALYILSCLNDPNIGL